MKQHRFIYYFCSWCADCTFIWLMTTAEGVRSFVLDLVPLFVASLRLPIISSYHTYQYISIACSGRSRLPPVHAFVFVPIGFVTPIIPPRLRPDFCILYYIRWNTAVIGLKFCPVFFCLLYKTKKKNCQIVFCRVFCCIFLHTEQFLFFLLFFFF